MRRRQGEPRNRDRQPGTRGPPMSGRGPPKGRHQQPPADGQQQPETVRGEQQPETVRGEQRPGTDRGEYPTSVDKWWRRTVLPGLLAGLAAAVLGYLVAFVATIGNETAFERAVSEATVGPIVAQQATETDVEHVMAQLGLPFDFPTWKVAGISWFDAHTVGSTYTADGRVVASAGELADPGPVWLLGVPVALLAVAGFLVARRHGATSSAAGARQGATIAIGYAIGVIALVVGSRLSLGFDAPARSTSAAVGPSLPIALLVGGLLYPVVLGGLGGTVAALVDDRDGSPD